MSEDKILIEKGIPISRCFGRKFPFDEMEVGDSFYVEGKSTIGSTANYAGKKLNMKFATRKEKSGIRIWRVE